MNLPELSDIITHMLKDFKSDTIYEIDDYSSIIPNEIVNEILVNYINGEQLENVFIVGELVKNQEYQLKISIDFDDIMVSTIIIDKETLDEWNESKILRMKYFDDNYIGDKIFVQGENKYLDGSNFFNNNNSDVIIICTYDYIDCDSINVCITAVIPYKEIKNYMKKRNPYPIKPYSVNPRMTLSYDVIEKYTF